ncbi:unnamed protein product [Durusdinium trenchii]|uniref:Uncharacterized protein n=1 Tax=Durusdinium trenchii TaxID=1381693 RepID=A0ABP0Q234_9DINO
MHAPAGGCQHAYLSHLRSAQAWAWRFCSASAQELGGPVPPPATMRWALLALLLAQGVAFKAELSKQAPAHQAEHAQLPVDSFVSRWSKQQKHLKDVEDMDYFWGMPKFAWVVVFDVIACIFYVLGMKSVTILARKRPEDTDYFLQAPV